MQPEIQVVASLNGKRNRNSFVHDHLNIPTAEIKRLIQMFLQKKKRLIQMQLEIQVVASWNRKRNQNSSKQECLATVSSVGGLTQQYMIPQVRGAGLSCLGDCGEGVDTGGATYRQTGPRPLLALENFGGSLGSLL
jgi:hypothetical protein